jgi:hypothetical protein
MKNKDPIQKKIEAWDFRKKLKEATLKEFQEKVAYHEENLHNMDDKIKYHDHKNTCRNYEQAINLINEFIRDLNGLLEKESS